MPITCKKCSKTFGFRQIIDGELKNLSGRKYCLDCSPFGKNNVKKLEEIKEIPKAKQCPKCKETKEIALFQKLKDSTHIQVYCKACRTQIGYEKSDKRYKKLKVNLIKSRGGGCEKCGYNKNIAALEFHHIRDKKFNLTHRAFAFRRESEIEEEAEKCLILCANCHREHHNPRWSGML